MAGWSMTSPVAVSSPLVLAELRPTDRTPISIDPLHPERAVLAVDGDVLRYVNLLQRVDFVMKGGVVYKRDGRPVEANLAPR